MVPSVPAPPPGSPNRSSRPKVVSNSNSNSNSNPNWTRTTAPPQHHLDAAKLASTAPKDHLGALPSLPYLQHSHSSSPTTTNRSNTTSPTNHAHAHAGAAYERKKQRAKDARIKLNDSIERLALGMSLAGSQSKQRAAMLKGRKIYSEPNACDKNKTINSMQDCALHAEQAKKWDRPSFVGTAASIVESLNLQTECLMRELNALQEQYDALKRGTPSPILEPIMEEGRTTPNSLHGHKRHEASSTSQAEDELELAHAAKRIRALSIDHCPTDQQQQEEENENHGDLVPIDVDAEQKIIFGTLSKLLDPISLSRCPCVSRGWRDMQVFDDDATWLDLAVQRFGFYNVRQWTEKYQDSSEPERHVPKKSIYKHMCASNVMPHFQQEGVILLGDAKIPGRVSAWVFMVERSNGETLRSVQRDPGSPGRGGYQSLPVVELRIILQNIGMATGPVVLKTQQVTVDTSTRRSGGEFKEIFGDNRFEKEFKNLDGTIRSNPKQNSFNFDMRGEICRLDLFDAAILNVHIHAKGCSTMSKFQQRSNFAKILVCLDGTTVPMVVPFLRDAAHS